jgi:replication factor A1
MKISDLKTNQGNVEVEGIVQNIGETRNFNKYGRELRVANAILSDESGSIKLTLWNDDVTRFKEGDKIKVSNGYVSEFQGEKQLTSGKFGRIEKISSGNALEETEKKGVSKKVNPEDEFSEEDFSEDSEIGEEEF